jgi:hypothetical protein
VTDYSKMTAEQLEKANQKLMAEKEAIREEQREIAKVLDRRAAEAKIGALSDAERDVLLDAARRAGDKPPAQTLSGAGGIQRKSKVGTPGKR